MNWRTYLNKKTDYVHITLLKAQLQVFELMLNGRESQLLHKIYKAFQSLHPGERCLGSEIVTI